MTPEQLDGYRAAVALVVAAADGDQHAATAILGRGWKRSRRALIAWRLAQWHANVMPRLGHDDPAATARAAIARSVAAEAEGAAP
jgi:hypothetical protein